MLQDEKYSHIDASERSKVIQECDNVEQWLKDMQARQNALPKSSNPVLLVADINAKRDVCMLFTYWMCSYDQALNVTTKVMNKPKPAPPKPETPTPAADADAKNEQTAPPPAEQAQQMDTD